MQLTNAAFKGKRRAVASRLIRPDTQIKRGSGASGSDGLGGYGSSEQQSICSDVHFAVSKRIEEAEWLQYAL